jgi:DNA-binding GntR family transcriptional regulator
MLLKKRPEMPLSDRVVEAVSKAIATGSLAPGQRLTEREMMERTGVSRTSIREALRQLRTLGLVEEGPSGGLQVALLDRPTIEHIYEVRAAIESTVAELFTRRATDAQIAQLVAAYDVLQESEGGAIEERMPSPPDEILFAGAGNPFLRDILDPFYVRLQWLRRMSLTTPGRYEASRAEMQEVVDAVRKRRPEEAAAAVRRHVAAAQESALLAWSKIR